MFMKIMAAIDGSETSMEALREAKRMAISHRATLRIVYAASDIEDANHETAFKLLATAKSEVGDGVDAETRLLHADAVYGLNGLAEAVATAANEWDADLVVLGSSNRRGLERLVIGSVAEQVLAKVKASVLLVRSH